MDTDSASDSQEVSTITSRSSIDEDSLDSFMTEDTQDRSISDSASEAEEDISIGTCSVSVSKKLLTPLFDSSNLTTFDSRLMLLQYSLKHSLTKVAFEDLLKLVNSHLPKGTDVCSSVYKLKQFFSSLNPLVIAEKFYYCEKCYRLTDAGSLCDGLDCTGSDIGNFSYIPIAAQFENKLKGENIVCDFCINSYMIRYKLYTYTYITRSIFTYLQMPTYGNYYVIVFRRSPTVILGLISLMVVNTLKPDPCSVSTLPVSPLW